MIRTHTPVARPGRLASMARSLAEPLEQRLLLSASDYTDLFSRAVVVGDAALTLYNNKAIDNATYASFVALAQSVQASPVDVTPAGLSVKDRQVAGTLATIHDTAQLPANWSAAYHVVIDWGDGQTSPAVLLPDGAQGFAVLAAHTYTAAGNFPVSLSLERKYAPVDASPTLAFTNAPSRTADVTTGNSAALHSFTIAPPPAAPPAAPQFVSPAPPVPIVTQVPLATITVPESSSAQAIVHLAPAPTPVPPPTETFRPIELGGYRLMESAQAKNGGEDPATFEGEFALLLAPPVPRGTPAAPQDAYAEEVPTAAAPPAATPSDAPSRPSVDAPKPSEVLAVAPVLPAPEPRDKRPISPARLLLVDRSWKLALVLSAGTVLDWAHRRTRRADLPPRS